MAVIMECALHMAQHADDDVLHEVREILKSAIQMIKSDDPNYRARLIATARALGVLEGRKIQRNRQTLASIIPPGGSQVGPLPVPMAQAETQTVSRKPAESKKDHSFGNGVMWAANFFALIVVLIMGQSNTKSKGAFILSALVFLGLTIFTVWQQKLGSLRLRTKVVYFMIISIISVLGAIMYK
jgi:hypothetical protein